MVKYILNKVILPYWEGNIWKVSLFNGQLLKNFKQKSKYSEANEKADISTITIDFSVLIKLGIIEMRLLCIKFLTQAENMCLFLIFETI